MLQPGGCTKRATWFATTTTGLCCTSEAKDTQVKLRDQRVELSEVELNGVECHVRQCFQGTRGVVAEVVKSKDWKPKLVVFVYWLDGQEPTDTALEELLSPPDGWFQDRMREFQSALAKRLPKYMVPDFILRVAVFR